jgi:hypothetical protein
VTYIFLRLKVQDFCEKNYFQMNVLVLLKSHIYISQLMEDIANKLGNVAITKPFRSHYFFLIILKLSCE